MKEAGNLYTTTISVLVSAVQKIARAMKLREGLLLFRGLGRLMDLPKEFFAADPQGRKGFVEWGFMSTTSDEQVGGGCESDSAVRGVRGRVAGAGWSGRRSRARTRPRQWRVLVGRALSVVSVLALRPLA
jgi:hypothetical protein